MNSRNPDSDHNGAWLIVFSEVLSGEQLRREMGLPEVLPNSLGRKPKPRTALLQSDSFLASADPVETHIEWLIDHIAANPKILEVLQRPGIEADFFVYVSTAKESVSLEIEPEIVNKIARLGCRVCVKTEVTT